MKRKYEIGLVINPEATEEEIKKILDPILEIIKKADGTIENIDEWGRKKLAYPIEKHNEGIYIFIHSDFNGSAFFDIERRLKLSEKVMRFIILRLDDKLKKANRLTKKWKRMEKFTRRTTDERSERNDKSEKPERTERAEKKRASSGDSEREHEMEVSDEK